MLRFKDVTTKESIDDLISSENMVVKLIQEQKFDTDNEFKRMLKDHVQACERQEIYLENGAQGIFIQPGNLDKTKRHPMVVILHGGPFGHYPADVFLKT
jgi:dipeptidyl aminopeptidase/acylaminoacyl peptidase